MNITSKPIGWVVLPVATIWLAALAPAGWAGPIEQARQLVKDGRYAQVDKALAEPLAQSPAPVEALRLSLEAAMADGRFVTAERRCQALLEQGGKTDADLVDTAARLARLTGQPTREAEMLGLLVNVKPGKSPRHQLALLRLMAIGTDASAFTRYISAYGCDEQIIRRGLAMQTRLFENGQAEDFATLTDALLKQTTDRPDLAGQAYQSLRRAADSGLFLHTPGKPADGSGKVPAQLTDEYRRYSRAIDLAMKYTIVDPASVWDMIQRSGQAGAKVVLRFHKQLSGLPDNRTFQQIRDARLWQDKSAVPANAAKTIVSWQKAYACAADRNTYRDYVAWLCGTPDLFGRLVDLNRMKAMAAELARQFADRPADLRPVTRAMMFACPDVDALKGLYKQFKANSSAMDLRQALDHLMSRKPEKQRLAVYRQIVGDDWQALYVVMDWLMHDNHNDLIKKIARTMLLAQPGSLNTRGLQDALIRNDAISPDERVAILDEVYRKVGYCNPLRQLVLIAKQHKSLAGSAPFKRFVKQFNRTQRGSDPIRTACARLALATAGRKQALNAVHKEVATALAAYGAKFPAGRPIDSVMAATLQRYYEICRDNKTASATLIETLIDHLGPAGPWYELSVCANRSNKPALRLRVIQACLAEKGPLAKLDSGTLVYAALPDQGSAYLLHRFYGQLPVGTAWASIRAVTDQNKQYAAGLAEVAYLLQVHKKIDLRTLADLANWVRRWADQVKPTDIPAALMDRLAESIGKPGYESVAGNTMALFARVGQLDKAIARYRAAMDKLGAAERFRRLSRLYAMVDDAHRVGLVEELYALGRSLDPVSRQRVQLSDGPIDFIDQQVRQGRGSREVQQKLTGLNQKLLDLVAEGLPLAGRRSRELSASLRIAVERKIKAGQAEPLVRLGALLMQWGESSDVRTVLTELRNHKQWELLYLIGDHVDAADATLFAFAQQLRGIAAANIPGIYPVGPKHPTFPLYVASSELVRGNDQLAWEMLRDHTAVFIKNPLRFDTHFVVWAIDKLRKVRGENNTLLEQARGLCDHILADEANLEASFAASITLLRANIFRDMGKLEAAELEYKSLLTNPRLQKTDAGRQARYRMVELMIARGNMAGASEQIERWLAFPDPQLHTQAYYYKALMAFNDKDYPRCRQMLNRVFERQYGHEQARLLEGEWRKKTKSLEDTDVYAGQIVELDRLIPGEELKLSIHDKNLSVIGEGSYIPVVITTSAGKDRETVGLYPAPRTANLFRSTIKTALGDARPGNLVLEVNGRDTVHYEIDPAFLKNRGLDGLPAKELTLVDDAWMSASAGQLLTEDEQKALALKQQVAAIRGEKLTTDRWASHRTVRPGNPLYIMVRDRDRDLTGERDSLEVSVTTSSGDRLDTAKLTETTGHSGLFRGAVPTALPLPRAYASDSAEGSDPAVLINSSRTGAWASKPDAQPDKWVEVDTMGSHLVKKATIALADPNAVNRLMLYGAFQGDPIRLGRFPASANGHGKPHGGLALHLKSQYFNNINEATLSRLRAALRQLPDNALALDRPVYDGRKNNAMLGHLAGVFYLAKGQNVPLTMISSANRDMKAYVMVDGAVAIGGYVRDLVKTTENVFIGAGAHRLEVFFYQPHQRCDFSVGWKNPDGQVQPLPAQWFSVKENPGLAEFLQDKAAITRTATGFVATFVKPVRLRKVRWHFAAYAGASIKATAITLNDDAGHQVLPVTHDFSTGLNNDQLEVAPGDVVTVTYRDTRNIHMATRVLTSQLDAGFANARVGFTYEVKAEMGQPSTYATAYRFRPGDVVTVCVFDPDADISDKADTVDVIVRSASGKELKLKALEAKERNADNKDQVHSAHFVAIVKTALAGAADPDTVQVKPGDRLQAFYLDQQNMSPGVPVVRASEPLPAVGSEPSRIAFLRGIREQVPDRRNPQVLHEVLHYKPISPEEAKAPAIVIDAMTPLRIELTNPCRALNSESTVTALVCCQSEIDNAKLENRKAKVWKMNMKVGGGSQALPHSTFQGELKMRLSSTVSLLDVAPIWRDHESDQLEGPLMVQGADTVHLTILDEQGKPELTRDFKLATAATIGLYDKNYEQPQSDIHMGEKFHLQIVDPDQDLTADHDTITVKILTADRPAGRPLKLTETLPHSGVFNASVRTVFNAPVETAAAPPAAATNGPAAAGAQASADSADTLKVAYGQTVSFAYMEKTTIPGRQPGERRVSGKVLLGDDGQVELFSKRYTDAETAARVQFRMAECLFEMAKEYRKVDNQQMASDAIVKGKVILEEAMQDYPNTSLVTEGTYLLANLNEELASEELAHKNPQAAFKLYQQATARFSNIISTWPDSPYAARAQFHKAMCLEKIGDSKQASEEYVRLCYAYPDSPLVADATIRLATHFYRQGRYDVSGRIYENFARHYPNHPQAPKVMFMAAQSHMKQAEVWTDLMENPDPAKADARLIGRRIDDAIQQEYRAGAKGLDYLIHDMKDATGPNLRAEAMYWSGIAYNKAKDLPTAYLRLKQVTFEYPETKWARMARGLLLQDEQLERMSRTK